MVPIYKSGDKKEVSNYSPISVLSFHSKIFEKIMYEYVVEFMDKNEIIFKNQFGLHKNHSTQHAVISLIHNIIHSQETDHMVISVFLDLKKAFDCVSHTILLKKLYQYGIRCATHKWFTSYLTGRTQYVAVDDKKSDIQKNTCGVPQGSVLGPLLFIAFANGICNASELLFYILYADDTAVLLKGKELRELLVILNEELERINLWLKANKLTLNTQKSVFMVFQRARLKSFNPPILINGTQLQEVSSTKYLGLIIDSKLKWIDHIAHIKKKISRGIGIITRVRPFVNKKCLSNLYHAFIYPYLLYCLEVWGNALDSHIKPLCVLQNKAIRIINFSHYKASSDPIYITLDILPLQKLVTHRIALMMYKYSHGMLPQMIQDLYVTNNAVHHYSTRQSNLLHVPLGVHTNIFLYKSILIWNKLSNLGISFDIPISRFKNTTKDLLQHSVLNVGYF